MGGSSMGLRHGFCLLIGGPEQAVRRLEPAFKALAPGADDDARAPKWGTAGSTAEQGYLHCGPSGAGHFVKRVHTVIEYALMSAYAGSEDLPACAPWTGIPLPDNHEDGEYRFDLSLLQGIAEVWRRSSVIAAWLLDSNASSHSPGSLMGTFEPAFCSRFRSRSEADFAGQLLSAVLSGFGRCQKEEDRAPVKWPWFGSYRYDGFGRNRQPSACRQRQGYTP